MANKPKAKGTNFETDCVRGLQRELGDKRIERRSLHGAKDMGDIYGIRAHGYEGIAEAKNYAKWGAADLAKWQRQTEAERGNADADFALLIVHKDGCGTKRWRENHCWLQLRDLACIAHPWTTIRGRELAMDLWLHMTVGTACDLISGKAFEE